MVKTSISNVYIVSSKNTVMVLLQLFFFKKKNNQKFLLYTCKYVKTSYKFVQKLKNYKTIRTVWIQSKTNSNNLKNYLKKQKNQNIVEKTKNLKKNTIFFSLNCSDLIVWQLYYTHCIFTSLNKFSSTKIYNENNYFFFSRPLLSLHRFDIQKICFFCKLPVFADKTNQKLFYSRNRIRKQVLPLFRFFFNPEIDKLLFQFSEILNDEQDYLNLITNKFYNQLEYKNTQYKYLDPSIFSKLPYLFCRKILKKTFETYYTKRINFFIIETLVTVLTNTSYSKLYLDRNIQNKNLFFKKKFLPEEIQKKHKVKEPLLFFLPKKGFYRN